MISCTDPTSSAAVTAAVPPASAIRSGDTTRLTAGCARTSVMVSDTGAAASSSGLSMPAAIPIVVGGEANASGTAVTVTVLLPALPPANVSSVPPST